MTFKDGGLGRLVEDFFLLAEYIESQQNERLQQWCKSLARFALSKDELAAIDKITDKETRSQALISKMQPPIQPLWSFFVAFCHALQEDDNELTARDAYWLGLIDEVMGDNSLVTPRWFEEWREDPKPPSPDQNAKDKIPPQEKTSPSVM